MPVLKLTTEFVANQLDCPDDEQRIEYCDSELPGLYVEVRVKSPDQGTFYLRYKDPTGKTCHQKIGRTTDITLADARKKAKLLKAEIALGADPRGQVKADKAVITFGDFFNDHYLPFAKPRKRSWRRDEELFRLRIEAKFGDRRLNQLTAQQIQTFHTSLLDSGLSPATADHHVKLIRRMLNLAVDWEMLDKNPAAGVPLFMVDNKVEHYVDDAQLQSLLTVLRTDENRAICRIAMFLLSTGCRLDEALPGQLGSGRSAHSGLAHPGIEQQEQAGAVGAIERQRDRGARSTGHRRYVRAPVRQPRDRPALYDDPRGCGQPKEGRAATPAHP